mgnify:CR=1 FL=1
MAMSWVMSGACVVPLCQQRPAGWRLNTKCFQAACMTAQLWFVACLDRCPTHLLLRGPVTSLRHGSSSLKGQLEELGVLCTRLQCNRRELTWVTVVGAAGKERTCPW